MAMSKNTTYQTYTVTLDYDPVWQALDWAKKHCASYITNTSEAQPDSTYHNRNYKIRYYFGTEADAVLFALHWR